METRIEIIYGDPEQDGISRGVSVRFPKSLTIGEADFGFSMILSTILSTIKARMESQGINKEQVRSYIVDLATKACSDAISEEMRLYNGVSRIIETREDSSDG